MKLSELETLIEQATPGPFEVVGGELDFGKRYVNATGLVGCSRIAKFSDDPEGWADAELYASIRTAIPDLIAAVRALPDPYKLNLLANWIDRKYPNDSDPEVQTDLRRWAEQTRAVLAKFEE